MTICLADMSAERKRQHKETVAVSIAVGYATINRVRSRLDQELQLKTSWGRNELRELIDRCINEEVNNISVETE